MQIRLQKIISAAGIASRRAAEKLIEEGRVSVNGRTVTELGTKADPDADDIRVDERRVKRAQQPRYFLLNKPRGYVTTRSDPENRPTVLDLLKGVREYVYPVGRLDFDSEGLLILTNDGELAATLTHPRHEVERVYEAQVLGVPDRHDLDRLRQGIVIEGRRTSPALVELLTDRRTEGSTSVLRVTIHEGRTRQVRKMADAIGHPVRTLKRVRIGPIADRNLRLGSYRELTAGEVRKLKHSGRHTQPPSPREKTKTTNRSGD
ncbi:MAG: rRNA pseudouridine synthase [Acidobacteria bacterium]|nr:MAG: rRNA pseudouridine synthase [Acidobacteriota bacterium]